MANKLNMDQLELLLETMEPTEIRAQYAADLEADPRLETFLQAFESIDENLSELKSLDAPPLFQRKMPPSSGATTADLFTHRPASFFPRKRPNFLAWALPVAAVMVLGLLWLARDPMGNLESTFDSKPQIISETDSSPEAEPRAPLPAASIEEPSAEGPAGELPEEALAMAALQKPGADKADELFPTTAESENIPENLDQAVGMAAPLKDTVQQAEVQQELDQASNKFERVRSVPPADTRQTAEKESPISKKAQTLDEITDAEESALAKKTKKRSQVLDNPERKTPPQASNLPESREEEPSAAGVSSVQQKGLPAPKMEETRSSVLSSAEDLRLWWTGFQTRLQNREAVASNLFTATATISWKALGQDPANVPMFWDYLLAEPADFFQTPQFEQNRIRVGYQKNQQLGVLVFFMEKGRCSGVREGS